MEPLIGALSGLAVAITGLGGVLWRAQQASRQNGHHQSEELRLLRSIDQRLGDAVAARTLIDQGHTASLSGLAQDLAFLKGRAGV